LAPELLATAGEKPSEENHFLGKAATVAAIASRLGMKVRIPNLKDLIMKPGAISAMLKLIMNFLRTRFPAFIGMNVLWSLALFGMCHFGTLERS
jgi:hypothetical protein